VDAHEPVRLSITTTGIPDGEAVRFEIFRIYRERPGDVIATLHAKLAHSAAKASWTPDSIEAPDDRFVFKASVGDAWQKSEPLTVRHHATSVDWSSAYAHDGDEVTLRTRLRGVRDGEQATIVILQTGWWAVQDTEVKRLQAAVSGGAVEAS